MNWHKYFIRLILCMCYCRKMKRNFCFLLILLKGRLSDSTMCYLLILRIRISTIMLCCSNIAGMGSYLCPEAIRRCTLRFDLASLRSPGCKSRRILMPLYQCISEVGRCRTDTSLQRVSRATRKERRTFLGRTDLRKRFWKCNFDNSLNKLLFRFAVV